eukprot:Nk52_evm14s1401 gene=Nk52_evmTU14s1401
MASLDSSETPVKSRVRAASVALKSPMESVFGKKVTIRDVRNEIENIPFSLSLHGDEVLLFGDFVELDEGFGFIRYVRLYVMSSVLIVAKRRTWRLKNSSAYCFEGCLCLKEIHSERVYEEDGALSELAFQVKGVESSVRIFQQTSGKSGSAESWLNMINFLHIANSDNLRFKEILKGTEKAMLGLLQSFGQMEEKLSMCETSTNLNVVSDAVESMGEYIGSISCILCEGEGFSLCWGGDKNLKAGVGVLIFDLCKTLFEEVIESVEKLRDIFQDPKGVGRDVEKWKTELKSFWTSLTKLEKGLTEHWNGQYMILLNISKCLGSTEGESLDTFQGKAESPSGTGRSPRRARRSSSVSDLRDAILQFNKEKTTDVETKRESFDDSVFVPPAPNKKLPPIPNDELKKPKAHSESEDFLVTSGKEARDSCASLYSTGSVASASSAVFEGEEGATPRKKIKSILKLFSPSGKKKLKKHNSMSEAATLSSSETLVDTPDVVRKNDSAQLSGKTKLVNKQTVHNHRRMQSDLSLMRSSGERSALLKSQPPLKLAFDNWQPISGEDGGSKAKKVKEKRVDGSTGNLFKSPSSRKNSKKGSLGKSGSTLPSMGSEILGHLLGELENCDWTDIMDLKPENVAKELTLIDAFHFSQIERSEFMNCSWMDKDLKRVNASNVVTMIEQFNRIALFVGTCVLKWESPNMRARVIQQFVIIAEKLKDYCNFNSLKAVISGLQATPVYRLKKTWALVSSKRHKQLRELAILMSEESNFRKYRNTLEQKRGGRANSSLAIIPYLGVHLTDFAFLDYVKKEHKGKLHEEVDNVDSVNETQDPIRDFLLFQEHMKYSFTSKPIVRHYLLNVSYYNEDEAYEMSLELEPKETKLSDSHSQSLDELRTFEEESPELLASKLNDLDRKLDVLYAQMNRMSFSNSESKGSSSDVNELWELQREATQLRRQLKKAGNYRLEEERPQIEKP